MRKRIQLFLSLILGFVLLGIWLLIVDVAEVFRAMKELQIIYIVPLTLFFYVQYYLRSLRWRIILSPHEKITPNESFKLCMSNYFLNFLIPIHAGEIARGYLLKKMKNTPLSKSLLTIYLDKMADALPIFFLLPAALFLSSQINSIIYMITGVVFLILTFLVVFILLFIFKKSQAFHIIDKALFFLPSQFKRRLLRFLELVFESVLLLPQLTKKLPEIIGLTLSALLVNCLFLWLFFYAFKITLSPLEIFVGYLLLNASYILPAPPGFAGSLELTVVFIFSYLFDYDKNIVSAVAASSHVFMAILFGVSGLISIILIGTSLSALFKIKPDER